MTITKDQLNLLRQSLQHQPAPELSPNYGAGIDANRQSFNDRLQRFCNGQKSMTDASRQFRQQVHNKIHLGVQQKNAELFPDQIPERDRPIAERTWTQASLDFHEGKLGKTSSDFKQSVSKAFGPQERSR